MSGNEPYSHYKDSIPCGDRGLAVGPAGSEVEVVDESGNITNAKEIASVTTTATPASGSCGVQFVFKNAAGVTMAVPSSGTCYLSEVATGLTQDLADTTFAVLTNGALTNIGGAGPSLYTTTAAGLLGVTITAAADDYYVVFVLPSGLLLISTVCTVNA